MNHPSEEATVLSPSPASHAMTFSPVSLSTVASGSSPELPPRLVSPPLADDDSISSLNSDSDLFDEAAVDEGHLLGEEMEGDYGEEGVADVMDIVANVAAIARAKQAALGKQGNAAVPSTHTHPSSPSPSAPSAHPALASLHRSLVRLGVDSLSSAAQSVTTLLAPLAATVVSSLLVDYYRSNIYPSLAPSSKQHKDGEPLASRLSLATPSLLHCHAALLTCLSASAALSPAIILTLEQLILDATQPPSPAERQEHDDDGVDGDASAGGAEAERGSLVYLLACAHHLQLLPAALTATVVSTLTVQRHAAALDATARLIPQTLRAHAAQAAKEMLRCLASLATPLAPPFARLQSTLLALKNNRLASPVGPPQTIRRIVRQFFGDRDGGDVAALLSTVTIADIQRAQAEGGAGRWWLGGSAWAGALAQDQEEGGDAAAVGSTAAGGVPSPADALEPSARRAAARLGLTDDLALATFATVASADDADAAASSLATLPARLRLPPAAAKRAMRPMAVTLLRLAAAELTPNPFYSHVLRKLAQARRSARLSLKYALWDEIRRVTSEEGGATQAAARAVVNLATLHASLVALGEVSLGTLRVLPFPLPLPPAPPAVYARSLIASLLPTLGGSDADVRTVARRVHSASLRQGLAATCRASGGLGGSEEEERRLDVFLTALDERPVDADGKSLLQP